MKKEEKEIIEIPEIKIKEAVLTIVGDSPLLIHKFSEKAKAEILQKQRYHLKTLCKVYIGLHQCQI